MDNLLKRLFPATRKGNKVAAKTRDLTLRLEALESRELLTTGLHLAFGSAGTPVPADYTLVTGQSSYNSSTGFGWQSGSVKSAPGANITAIATFAANLPNGTYQVSALMGDPASPHTLMMVSAPGSFLDLVSTGAGQSASVTRTVSVSSGKLVLALGSLGGSSPTAAIERLDVIPVGSPTQSLAAPLNFDFGPAGAGAVGGATRVTEATDYNPAAGYGWKSGTVSTVDRGSGHFAQTTNATFAADVANGTYKVTAVLGDPSAAHTLMEVYAQGSQIATVSTQAGQTRSFTANVVVTNGQFLLQVDDVGGAGPTVALDSLQIVSLAGRGQPPAPLTAAFSGPSSVNEGATSAQVAFASPAGGTGGYTYSYDFNNDGAFEVAGSKSASATVPESFLDDGPSTRVVRGRITDSSGAFKDYTTSIAVTNVAPTPGITAPSSAVAGSAAAFAASATDPSSADTQAGFTYSWNFGDGSGAVAGASASHTFASAGTYAVTLTAADKNGGKGTATASVTVASAGTLSGSHFVFGAAGTSTPSGYTLVTDKSAYNSSAGNGWQSGTVWAVNGADITGNATFALDLPNGTYQVSALMGDPAAPHTLMIVSAQGSQLDMVSTAAAQSTSITRTVTVSSGQLQLNLSDLGGSSPTAAIERLDVVPVGSPTQRLAAPLNFDFGPATASPVSGSTRVTESSIYNPSIGSGWHLGTVSTVDRGNGHFAQTTNATFAADVANGTYKVTAVLGDPSAPHTQMQVFTQGGSLGSGDTAAGQTLTLTGNAVVTNGELLVQLSDNGGNNPTVALDSLQIVWVSSSTTVSQPPSSPNPGSQPPSSPAAPSPGVVLSVDGPFKGYVGSPLILTAGLSTGNSYVSFAWTFGDGTTGSGQQLNHAYAGTGSYTIGLTATTQEGKVYTTSTTATINPAQVVNPPAPQGFITTPEGKIPNFGANPNIIDVHSGNWSDPSTWSLGRVPTAGDVVSIAAGTTVSYDVVSSAPVYTVAVQNGGTLTFRTDINTQLLVTNLLVMPGGTLQVGTTANPVGANVTASIVIADSPIDATTDPSQFGHGLIGLGTVTMHGSVKSQTFVNLAAEPHAGDTTLTLSSAVSGWRVGDKLLLPDTRQLYSQTRPDTGNFIAEWEAVTLAGISADGLTVTLSAPLQYDHLGAHDPDGKLLYTPDVSNLTRNVVVRSQNARGTRGYALFTGQANVDVEYAQFSGLGRSLDGKWDNTTYDANGNVTHVGTNEQDRSAVSFLHLYGPQGGQPDGYQYTFTGNSVFCPVTPMAFRWGILLNDSHFGLIKDNVLYNWAGAGIMLENGNETGNVIAHNDIVAVTSAGTNRADDRGWGDVGHEGSGIWMRGVNNYVDANVVSDANFGYTIYTLGQALDGGVNTQVPLAPGDNPWVSGHFKVIDMTDTPILEFSGNAVYGATGTGMTIWSVGTGVNTPHADARESVVKNLVMWHTYDKGYYGYETNRLTMDGLVFVGDTRIVATYGEGPIAVYSSDYFQQNFTIKNSTIEGAKAGWMPSVRSGGTQTIENSYLRNYTNIALEHMWRASSTAQSADPRTTVIRDVTFAPLLAQDRGDLGSQSNILMIDSQSSSAQNFVQLDQVFVYDYNGVAGDNFQVYYAGQAANAIVPKSTYNANGTTIITGAPIAGLTNAQAWAQYHIAVAGAVAPPASKQRAGIIGLVDPLNP